MFYSHIRPTNPAAAAAARMAGAFQVKSNREMKMSAVKYPGSRLRRCSGGGR